jgi:hypothetical protein
MTRNFTRWRYHTIFFDKRYHTILFVNIKIKYIYLIYFCTIFLESLINAVTIIFIASVFLYYFCANQNLQMFNAYSLLSLCKIFPTTIQFTQFEAETFVVLCSTFYAHFYLFLYHIYTHFYFDLNVFWSSILSSNKILIPLFISKSYFLISNFIHYCSNLIWFKSRFLDKNGYFLLKFKKDLDYY